ncbi:MAG: hypothetical protein WD077_06545 [Bacteroidia bacterium]
MKAISARLAGNAIILILVLVIGFYLLVLFGLVPYQVVWGGRLETAKEMYVFEFLSIVINLLIIAVVAMHAGYLKPLFSKKSLKILFWIFAILFALNTIGNILAENTWETIIFGPLTFFLSLLFFRLATEKTDDRKETD